MTQQSSGHAVLTIASDHPAFAGHFPGLPIVPGVVLLDEALYAIGMQIDADLSTCQLSSVKFLSPVSPGEPVAVSYDISATGAIRFDISTGERKVASGTLRLAGSN